MKAIAQKSMRHFWGHRIGSWGGPATAASVDWMFGKEASFLFPSVLAATVAAVVILFAISKRNAGNIRYIELMGD
jgi:hypothetical protein